MGFFDRLFGDDSANDTRRQPDSRGRQDSRSEDEIAIERYRYLLRTAPPETIEEVHREAFEKLTPEQRQQVFAELSANAPVGEQPRGNDARSLAQSATRSELRSPGTLERSFAGRGTGLGGGMGFGGMLGSSLLGTVAGYVIGSAIVGSFMSDGDGGTDASADGSDTGSDASDSGDTGSDGGDFGGGDYGGGDFGGGSDFGGGDFGGDFGSF